MSSSTSGFLRVGILVAAGTAGAAALWATSRTYLPFFADDSLISWA